MNPLGFLSTLQQRRHLWGATAQAEGPPTGICMEVSEDTAIWHVLSLFCKMSSTFPVASANSWGLRVRKGPGPAFFGPLPGGLGPQTNPAPREEGGAVCPQKLKFLHSNPFPTHFEKHHRCFPNLRPCQEKPFNHGYSDSVSNPRWKK